MNEVHSIGQILWSTDPAAQRAIWLVLGFALVSAITVFLPLVIRLARLSRLQRRLRPLAREMAATDPIPEALAEDFDKVLLRSPIRHTYAEFKQRWQTSQISERSDRAPVRLMDIFDERPLLPLGPRRSLLPVLPGLFLAIGVFAALGGLIPSLTEASSQAMTPEAREAWMASQLGLALRAAIWGFLCAIGATLTSRLIEGAFEARSQGLDRVVESAFGSISPGELAELTRRTQQTGLDTLGRELTYFANELNERLDRGLQRIEQSTARSASLVSQEQRGALHTVVQEISLSVRQGVEHHLGELRGALQRAVEHQSSVTGGLAEAFSRMVENAKTQDRVAATLAESAGAVEDAARSMRSTTAEIRPVFAHIEATSEALAKTAERIAETQLIVARTADGVRVSLEHAAHGVEDQRQFIELSLGEIRRTLVGLGDGLGDSLQRSLREVDDLLGKSIGQLRDTLAESNETIDRLSSPLRAAEGSTREIHLAIDRVRGEVDAVAGWISQAVKPLRGGLADVEGRAEEISRSMAEFNSHARQIDKTMEALRHEIHEESRRLHGTGSDLSRKLQQASEAIGMFESATSEVTRRSRVEPETALPRERHWSPWPTDRSASSDRIPDRTRDRIPDRIADPARDPVPDRTPEAAVSPESTSADLGPEPRAPEDRLESGGSGFRVGAPRAQGPDPYQRFDAAKQESTSNLRHFPTSGRGLGEDLKLSGLLGPRGTGASEPEADAPSDATLARSANDDERPAGDGD